MHCYDRAWFDTELGGCKFKDERIKKRFRFLIENLWHGVGKSIPLACQDWSGQTIKLPIDFCPTAV